MRRDKRYKQEKHNCYYDFQYNYNDKEYELSFKLSQLYYIDDCLSILPEINISNNNTKLFAPESLIEKIALTIIGMEMTGKIQKLNLNFTEAMIIREVAQSNIIIAGENIGLNIKKEVMSMVFGHAYINKLKNENLLKSINNHKS